MNEPIVPPAEELVRARPRDIVVIGASLGGIETVPRLVSMLPADLPAAVFVALHLPANYGSEFAALIAGRSTLPAHLARDGEAVMHGRIYVAPGGYNMSLERGRVVVEASPRESFHRPSINALFRTAALAYGGRVACVVLTGQMDDGSAGAWAVWRCGGVVIVQDPGEAQHSSMPRHVMSTVPVDHCAPVAGIAALIVDLAKCQKAQDAPLHPRIMIVEDERIVALTLEQDLRALGYDVCASAMTGADAVHAAERTHPDLILMDIHLGSGMDGTQAALTIWKHLQIPVVYLTAYADDDTLAAVKRTEAYGYVMKPYHAREVHAAIQIALERRSRETRR